VFKLKLDPFVLALSGGVYPLSFAGEHIRECCSTYHLVGIFVYLTGLEPVRLA